MITNNHSRLSTRGRNPGAHKTGRFFCAIALALALILSMGMASFAVDDLTAAPAIPDEDPAPVITADQQVVAPDDESDAPVEKTVKSISLINPAKTEYIVNEKLTFAGMVVTATYDDGTTGPVTDYFAIPAADTTLNTSHKGVIIYYKGRLASFPIQVKLDPAKDAKLTVNQTTGGTIVGGPSGTVREGWTVSLRAYPDPGYKFVRWEATNSQISDATANPLYLDLKAGESTIRAIWESVPVCQVSVKTQGLGLVLGSYAAQVNSGTNITMMALPIWPFSRFDHWEVNGQNAGDSAVLNYEVTRDATFTAVFK